MVVRCVFHGGRGIAGGGLRDCGGRLQEHHLVPKQRIRRLLKKDPPRRRRAVADRRNLVWICWRHHQLVENRRIYVPKRAIPEGFVDFIEEFDLHPAVGRDLWPD